MSEKHNIKKSNIDLKSENADVMPKVVEYELYRRGKKFDQFVGGYVSCTKCGKLVDDGGFFKNTNDWGCFDCLESKEKGDKA